jgi:hypothetical protein
MASRNERCTLQKEAHGATRTSAVDPSHEPAVNLQRLRRAMKNPGETFIVAMGALFSFKDSTCDVFMSHSKKALLR